MAKGRADTPHRPEPLLPVRDAVQDLQYQEGAEEAGAHAPAPDGRQGGAADLAAEVAGDHRGSTELLFSPGEVTGGVFHCDIGTAGSTSLVLQTLIPALAFARKRSTVTLNGGDPCTVEPVIPVRCRGIWTVPGTTRHHDRSERCVLRLYPPWRRHQSRLPLSGSTGEAAAAPG